MRTFLAALIAAAAIQAPTLALAAKPTPDLVLTATAVPAAAGSGCVISATGTWDGIRVAQIAFVAFDSSAINQGFVDAGAATSEPRPSRAGNLTWTAQNLATSGSIHVEASFVDHRGYEIGRMSTDTFC